MTRSTRLKAKRQPFGELSNDAATSSSTDKASKRKTKASAIAKKDKCKRRQSRQIGDNVVFYVQERKAKSRKLYRATTVAGGLVFTPANRKTPIAYDRNRHILIEKTPDGEEIEVELDCWEDKENIDKGSDDEEDDRVLIAPCKQHETSKRPRTKTSCYADLSSDDESAKDEGDFVEEVPTDTSKMRTSKSKKKRVEPKECDDEPPPRNKSFSSPITKANWEDEQNDWRCSAAMDY